jgi:hypothetical protein
MKEKFEIRNLPVILMTGIDGIASLRDDKHLSTAYVRIDNEERLKSVDSTLKCVQMIFNLFIGGEILEAINSSKESSNNGVSKNTANNDFLILATIGSAAIFIAKYSKYTNRVMMIHLLDKLNILGLNLF